MPFICQNPACTAPDSKKGKEYPAAMDCPFCDAPLVSQQNLTDTDKLIVEQYPYILAYPYNRMLDESDARNKLELLAYTFLNGMKLLGLQLATEYFRSDMKSPKINELFRNNLFQPSYGNWNNFLREVSQLFQKEQTTLIFPEFMKAYVDMEINKAAKKYITETPYTNEDGQVSWKKSELTAIGTLINFRNRYLGHGVPLSKDEYTKIYNEIVPVFNDFMSHLAFTTSLSLIKYEQKEAFLLKGKTVVPITPDTEKIKTHEGLITMESDDGRIINMLPFLIMPKRFISGVDIRAEIMVYEQNTGQRVVFFSPESIKGEESGQVLERIRLLLSEKEKESPCDISAFTIDYISRWLQVHNDKTLDGLKKEKKIIEGVYQNRLDAETVLSGWIGGEASLLFIAAEAGSGKTNLLTHMLAQYQRLQLQTLLLRAGRCESEDFELILRNLLNAPVSLNLPEYINNHFNKENPLMILVDGGNEHPKPIPFLESIIALIEKINGGHIKIVLSWRVTNLEDLPKLDQSLERFIIKGESNDTTLFPASHALRLKGLNKIELEGAWNAYAASKSGTFKPQFSFSDLLLADSQLVEELNNPLLLRLFLELFHQKSLPKSVKGFINLWAKWWERISVQKNEAEYLIHLAGYMMKEKRLAVSLDELFDHPILSDAVKNIQIDSPHQQLRRKGVISQYFQHDCLQVSFTMEAALYYVASLSVSKEDVSRLVKENKMWHEPVKYFIWERVSRRDDDLLFKLIDEEDFPPALSSLGLAQYLILHGTEYSLQMLLGNPSANDWKILKLAFLRLADVRPGEKQKRADEILNTISDKINADNTGLILHLLGEASKSITDNIYNTYFTQFIITNAEDALALGRYFSKYGQHHKAKEIILNGLNLSIESDFQVKYDLYKEIINECRQLSLFLDAWKYIDEWENWLKESVALPDLILAEIYSERGKIKEHLARYSEAMEFYKKAEDVFNKKLGLYHIKTLSNQQDIADVNGHLGLYNEGLHYYETVLDKLRKIYGDNHYLLATCYSRIGALFSVKGDNDSALKYHENSLQILIKYFGEKSSTVADTYIYIAGIYRTKGEYYRSIDFYNKALEIQIQCFGEIHPSIASSYNGISLTKGMMAEFDDSLFYANKSLNITNQYYGQDHPKTAEIKLLIGSCYITRFDFDSAIEYAETALNIFIKSFGDRHISVASVYSMLGSIYSILEDLPKALEYLNKGVAILIETFGEKHPPLADSYCIIGQAYLINEDNDNAMMCFKKGLELYIDKWGNRHPGVALCLNHIGEILLVKQNFYEALDTFSQCLSIRIETHGEQNLMVGLTFINLGEAYCGIGDFQEALENFEKGQKIKIEHYGEYHVSVAADYNRIGNIWEKMGDQETAQTFFDRSTIIYKQLENTNSN